MAKQLRSKKRMTRKMRRGGDSSSSEKVGMTRPASESRIFSRPASLKSKSKSKSKSVSKSNSRSKSKSSSKKSVSAEDYVEDTCPICFEHLSLNPIVTTKCKHTFHEECLIGWCSAQHANKTCPVCRADIKDTCDSIGPFDSKQIFRYIQNRWSARRASNNEMAYLLIANPKFDPNVRATYFPGDSETFSLFWHLARDYNWELLEKLLARPDLVISASDAADYAGTDRIRKLIIKYNKVPKALKKLWM